MAKTNSILLQQASGHIGRQFVFRQYGGQTLITKYPDMSKRVLSPKQIKNNERMEQANYYARTIMANDEQCSAAQVRLNVTSNRLYTTLVKEYYANERMRDANALNQS